MMTVVAVGVAVRVVVAMAVTMAVVMRNGIVIVGRRYGAIAAAASNCDEGGRHWARRGR